MYFFENGKTQYYNYDWNNYLTFAVILDFTKYFYFYLDFGQIIWGFELLKLELGHVSNQLLISIYLCTSFYSKKLFLITKQTRFKKVTVFNNSGQYNIQIFVKKIFLK